jgi:hypothetical protein
MPISVFFHAKINTSIENNNQTPVLPGFFLVHQDNIQGALKNQVQHF